MGFRWWDKLQAAAPHVVARIRTTVFLLGALGAAEAQNLADGLDWPESAKWFRRIFTVCMGVSLLLRAGDKTPENVKELAKSLTPPDGTPKP